jgi:hypothetical protein
MMARHLPPICQCDIHTNNKLTERCAQDKIKTTRFYLDLR